MREREQPCCVHRVDPSNCLSPGSGHHPSLRARPSPLVRDACLPQWCDGLWVVLLGSGYLLLFYKVELASLERRGRSQANSEAAMASHGAPGF